MKFRGGKSLAVKTILSRLESYPCRHEQPQSPAIIHKCLIFICLCFNLYLRLPGRLWSCIITSFIFLSIQYYDSLHHLPSTLFYSPWCRSPCCRCILLRMHLKQSGMLLNDGAFVNHFFSSLDVEASDFNSIHSSHKRTSRLPTIFLLFMLARLLLDKSQKEEEE